MGNSTLLVSVDKCFGHGLCEVLTLFVALLAPRRFKRSKMNRESVHRKISEIIELLEVNNNRLFLHEEDLSDFDLQYLKKLTLSLYEQIDTLGLSNRDAKVQTETAPEPAPVEDVVEEPEVQEEVEEEPVQEIEESPEPETEDEPEVAQEELPEKPEPVEEAPEVEEPIAEEELEAEPEVEEPTVTEAPDPAPESEPTPAPENANLYERLRLTKIESVKRAISVSKRFEFQNSLFDKSAERYNDAINALDSAGSLDAANTLLKDLSNEFEWDMEDELVQELQTILLRRFMD